MNTVNHALWGATIGRTVGLPIEGALLGAMPDLLTVPLLGAYTLNSSKPPETAPRPLMLWYFGVHNWFIGAVLVLGLFFVSPPLGILGLAYLWHIIEDAFLHTKMAVPFLFPLWKGKVQRVSAHERWWIQLVDLAAIILANILISTLGY